MKQLLTLAFAAMLTWAAGCASSNNGRPDNQETFRTEDELSNSKLNNRRLEKNLDKYAAELDLSKRQLKQLKRIDKRYNRLERKLSRNDGKRRDKRKLAEEKRKEMIDVLTAEQEQKLEDLARKGRFSLDQIFGR